MTMAVNPAIAAPGSSAGMSISRVTAETSGGQPVRISFSPPTDAAAPMTEIGSGILDRLRNFEATRSEHRKAMSGMAMGPASAVDAEKAKLLAGPASIRPASSAEASAPAKGPGFQDAVSAMTRSFDYAIETQLVVKTGSQLSTSASSMMRGQ